MMATTSFELVSLAYSGIMKVMNRTATSKASKVVSKPLKDVVCYVETFNDDGSSACDSTIKVLQHLGATVDPVFKMGLTHMIWSNGNLKHVKAAEFMDITVVSPLWVENCREAGKMVSAADFVVSPDTAETISKPKSVQEPLVKPASFLREPDSPSFSSSQIIASTAQHPLRVLDGNAMKSTQLGAKSKRPVNKRKHYTHRCILYFIFIPIAIPLVGMIMLVIGCVFIRVGSCS
jgi:hypothetical protein